MFIMIRSMLSPNSRHLLARSLHQRPPSQMARAPARRSRQFVAASPPKEQDAQAAADQALVAAVRVGSASRVVAALDRGAYVHHQDSTGKAALHIAVLGGYTHVAEQLLARGADVGAKDLEGWTPLHYAAVFNEHAVVELLLAKGADAGTRSKD